jgi:hypothetical protein
MAQVWLPVRLRGSANAKSVGEGRMLMSEKSSVGGTLTALRLVASKDSTLASSEGCLVRASAPGL